MGTPSLEQQVGTLLVTGHFTIAVAESCTGGLICHRLTNVSGSSDYFLGGIVSYSNQAKIDLLGVPAATIDKWGAVSEACVKAMAEGVRRVIKTDMGVAVGGIAGPTGGLEGQRLYEHEQIIESVRLVGEARPIGRHGRSGKVGGGLENACPQIRQRLPAKTPQIGTIVPPSTTACTQTVAHGATKPQVEIRTTRQTFAPHNARRMTTGAARLDVWCTQHGVGL